MARGQCIEPEGHLVARHSGAGLAACDVLKLTRLRVVVVLRGGRHRYLDTSAVLLFLLTALQAEHLASDLLYLIFLALLVVCRAARVSCVAHLALHLTVEVPGEGQIDLAGL